MAETGTAKTCKGCGAEMRNGALACPECRYLAHSAELEQLAAQARAREAAGDARGAIELWQNALELLPSEAEQAAAIRNHVSALAAHAASTPSSSGSSWLKKLGPVGTFLAVAFSKLKFLFFGLAKLKTLLTMFASMGLYWALYGWKFGVGFVLGIYVHEMGHVWSLRQHGLRASVPMFIPGFGALVSLYDSPRNVGEDARIGLAGPIWGAGAALAFLLPQLVSPNGIWMALAHSMAFINLFNLIPVWQLDGGRGFRALDKQQRFLILGLMLTLWYLTNGGLFLLLSAGAAYRIFMLKDHAPEADRTILMQFAGLLILFGGLLARFEPDAILNPASSLVIAAGATMILLSTRVISAASIPAVRG